MDPETAGPPASTFSPLEPDLAEQVAAARALPVIPPSPPISEIKLPEGTTHWGTDLKKMAETESKMIEAANKMPSIVKEALSPRDVRVAGRPFHVFTIQTYLNLEQLDSPFLPNAKKQTEKIGMRDIARTLWVMIEDDAVVEKTIAAGDDSVYAQVTTFACAIPVGDLPVLLEAIVGSISGVFAPAAKLDPPKQEGGGTPLSVAATATVPAGS